MRALTYSVAASLGGFIAGSQGEVDWLFTDEDYGLTAFLETVDTVLIGQATYDFMVGERFPSYPGLRNVVFSRTLRAEDHPEIEVVSGDPAPFMQALKEEAGAGIRLVGGGVVFCYLLDAHLVDEVVVTVHPILLGGGIPLPPRRDGTTYLRLREVVPCDTGLVSLSYQVLRPT
jgi:dihydrofolate reductase